MQIIPSKALVVLSGGQDSTTCLYWAKTQFDEVHAITFDYGQRHRREIAAAKAVAAQAAVASHEIIELGANILASSSPLTAHDQQLETYTDADAMAKIIGDRVELTFVPMRNALFLTLAANRAISRQMVNLVTGVCQEDNANYPDCRQSFIDATEAYIEAALGLDLGLRVFKIHTPLMHKSKAETCMLAKELDAHPKAKGAWAALAFTHTAYSGEYPPITQDHATVLRADGFFKAGLPDPLIMRAWREGLMPLPKSSNYDIPRSAA